MEDKYLLYWMKKWKMPRNFAPLLKKNLEFSPVFDFIFCLINFSKVTAR